MCYLSGSADLLFERVALVISETVRLGNNRNDIDNFAQFFHNNHVYGAKRVSCRVDKVKAAVDARVLDVTVTHRSELLAKVRAVLVLDILDNRIPATTSTTVLSTTAFLEREKREIATNQFSLLTWSP